MNPLHRHAPEPTGASTLDLLLLTAGFAWGWAMQENSRFVVGEWNFSLPLWYGGCGSVLGVPWLQWLWAFLAPVGSFGTLSPTGLLAGSGSARGPSVFTGESRKRSKSLDR
jgi:hypothetical protein